MFLTLAYDCQIGLAVIGVPERIVLADEIDDRMPARLEVSHQPVYSRLRHRSVVVPVLIGVPDKEQFLSHETIDLRVVRSGHRGPCLRTDID